jgi:hypothetical protein
MLALQLVIGVGIALLFPLLIYTGVAAIKAPPRPSNRTNLRAEVTEEDKQANRDQIRWQQEQLQKARVEYAKILFTVMAPAGLAAVVAGYLIGSMRSVSAFSPAASFAWFTDMEAIGRLCHSA